MRVTIDENACEGCGLCARECPEKKIVMVAGRYRLTGGDCLQSCGICAAQCMEGAIGVNVEGRGHACL